MAKRKFVSYLRVSTARQGTSGLGLEAQRAAVTGFLNGEDWTLMQEVLEVQSGKRNDRPALATALKLRRKHRATLVIAKLDRRVVPDRKHTVDILKKNLEKFWKHRSWASIS